MKETYYLSDDNNIPKTLTYTGLALDEIEYLVGRFNKMSSRTGKLRGKVNVFLNGTIEIRHHFTNKLLWSNK